MLPASDGRWKWWGEDGAGGTRTWRREARRVQGEDGSGGRVAGNARGAALWREQGMGLSQGRQHNNNFNNNFFNGVTERA